MKTILVLAVLIITIGTSFGQINPTDNIIVVDVSTLPQNASFDYDSCFLIGTDLGMGQIGLYQDWTALETAPLIYDFVFLDIANFYYTAANIPLDLTVAPISTNNLEVPSDLTATSFDDPVMINRFKTLLDSIKVHLPDVTLSSLIIGSEHDIYFGANATLWTAYTTFYDTVSAYARTLWPGLKVATELSADGIISQNTLAQLLNANSDYIGISYYPLNSNFTVKPVSTIPTDFATFVSLYPSKPICFYQFGYPSSSVCNSNEVLQAQFIEQAFQSWDTYATNIRLIAFTWLHDLDTAAVNYYKTYYGISDTAFLEYLRTIGLRTWDNDGTDKLALHELRCQAKERGYNSLNINCTMVEIMETEMTQFDLSIFPNPADDFLYIKSNMGTNLNIKIFNTLGQKIYATSNYSRINLANFKNGIYFINIGDNNTSKTYKLLIQH